MSKQEKNEKKQLSLFPSKWQQKAHLSKPKKPICPNPKMSWLGGRVCNLPLS